VQGRTWEGQDGKGEVREETGMETFGRDGPLDFRIRIRPWMHLRGFMWGMAPVADSKAMGAVGAPPPYLLRIF